MSLLYSVVFASRCTSTHHRLAVDALRFLRSDDAEAWRTLFLHHHVDYLKGAKAPDDQFKDFKNHVLHVRDNEWGGAPEACEEWKKRTVRALRDKDWAQAAWSAGVMSHYYVDPIQPFHTAQTEEEGVIHGAVERSIAKSYLVLQKMLEQELGGYPEVEKLGGETWAADMVRAGARHSNPFYETLIDHYNHAAGVRDPQAGLDDELKRVIARLIGYAASGFARMLDGVIAEAAVAPPQLSGDLTALFLALEVPIQFVLKKIEDSEDRKFVAAQYEEFRRTGKVRETLREDDKVVRALHAAEVLSTPLSSLDARWPREVGLQARANDAPPAKKVKKPAAPKPAKAEKPPPVAKPAKAEKPKQETPANPVAATPPIAAMVAPPPAKEQQPAKEKQNARSTLQAESPVVDAPSIGPKTARRLEAVGVHTVGDLLSLQPATGAVLIDQRHVSAQLIQEWQAQAALACAIPGLRSREAQALVACGVSDASELVEFEPSMLAEGIERWSKSEEAVRAWGAAPAPTEAEVAAWIEHARAALGTIPQRAAVG